MIVRSFEYQTLLDYEKQKKLKHGKHPIYDLHIWNYAETVQFSKGWDEITETCRGLITDGTGEIIARSFPKFFNLEEIAAQKVSDWMKYPYSVYEKVDGSLGILFYYHQEKTWIFASRGSFTSEQSQEAMKMLTKNHPNFSEELEKNVSYVFEIIYPDNQIVVNYGDRRELVLLGMYNNENGEEIPISAEKRASFESLGYKVVSEIPAKDLWSLKADNLTNQEGYVVKFHTSTASPSFYQRMKIKFENYILLHRAVSNISVKRLFDLCQEGHKFEEIIQNLPDEFHDWCSAVYQEIETKFNEIVSKAREDCQSFYHSDRPTFARSIQAHPYKKLLFCLYSGNPESKIRTYVFEKVLTVAEFEEKFPAKGERAKKSEAVEEKKDDTEKEVNEVAGKIEDLSIKSTGSSSSSARPEFSSGKIGSGFSKKPNMNTGKPYAIILIGVSGSGKSTWTKNHLAEHKDFVVISRDQIRRQLFSFETEQDILNYYQLGQSHPNEFNKKEMFVSAMQESMISTALQQRRNVIVDNTHLKLRFLKEMVKLIGDKAHVYLKNFEPLASVDEIMERIRKRPYNNSMAREVIERQIEDYRNLFAQFASSQDLLTYLQQQPDVKPIVQNPSLPPCYIFDIDGTLALNNQGRSYYDMSRVDEDDVNPPVVQMLHNLKKLNYPIIICTGRNQYASVKTEEWLRKNGIPFDEIHYRPDNDSEKDCYVKERMWKDICSRYYIAAMYDDRNQVVNHARNLGFAVFQVDENSN